MKNFHKLKFALAILAVAWGTFVIIGYFFQIKQSSRNYHSIKFVNLEIKVKPSHKYYFDAFKSLATKGDLTHQWKINPLLYALSFLFCIYSLYVIYKTHRGINKIDINAPPILFLGLFSLIFFILYYAFLSYYKAGTDVNLLLFFRNYLWRLLEILLFAALISSTGKSIYEFLEKKKESDLLNLFMFSFAIGAATVIFLTFLLGLFGQINQKAVLISFLVLAILSVKNIAFWIRQLFTRSVNIKTSYFSPQVFLLLTILILASYNFLNLSRPIPIGHDELEQYMNMSNLMASQGKLLSQSLPYPWQLLISSILAVSRSINFAMIFSSLSGFLVLLVIYKIVRMYCIKRNIEPGHYPLLAGALFFTLPAVVFQLSQDIKMDLPAMFFAGLALIIFWQWQDSVNSTKKLFLACFLAGFSFLIKPTFLFFILSLAIYCVIVLARNRLSLKKSLTIMFFASAFVLLPFVPFGIKNSIELMQAPRDKAGISSFWSGYSNNSIINLTQKEQITAKENDKIFSSSRETELNRYGNFKIGIYRYICYPVIVTFNSSVGGQYVDIGFVFLLFIPLLFILLLVNRREKIGSFQVFKDTLVAGAAYFILWATFSRGVIWYGFAGFIFLVIFLTEFLYQTKMLKVRWPLYAVNIILIFWLLLNSFQRTAFLPQYNINVNKDNLIYASGKMSDSEYYSRLLPSFSGITNFLNEQIDDNNNPPKIYLIGKYIKFFIHSNNKTVYSDNELIAYLSISKGKSGPEVIDRLEGEGIEYIVIENNISFFGDSAELLRVKLVELETTIKNNPDKVRVLLDEKKSGILFAKIL